MSKIPKIILIIGFIVIVVILGYVLYFVFFKPLSPVSPNGNENVNAGSGLPTSGTNVNIRFLPTEGGVLPTVRNPNVNASPLPLPQQNISDTAIGGITRTQPITPRAAFRPTIGQDGTRVVYYDSSDGKFYQVSSDGKSQLLSDKSFYQVENITWSPKKDSAILEYPDGANIFYNFNTQKQTTLPKHWQDFDFSPDGDRIGAKSFGVSKDNRYLITSNPNGSDIKIISGLSTEQDNIQINWSPNKQVIALATGDVDLSEQEIFFVGLNNENFKSMVVEGWGFQGQWSKDGQKLLYSVYNADSDNKPELWISDATPQTVGRNRHNIKIQTWASKCTVADANTAFCAVPENLQSGAGLYPDEMDNGRDILYQVNLDDGTKSVVAYPEQSHTMRDLIVSDDGKYLYYTDRNDGRLYRIQLR